MAGTILILYLDSSALLKIYVPEAESAQVEKQMAAAASNATSVITYAEVRAAIAARERARASPGREAVKRLFESDWQLITALEISPQRCREAGDLAETYALRGCDSIQLACYAHLVRTAAPAEVVFCCFDKALAAAAAHWLDGFRQNG